MAVEHYIAMTGNATQSLGKYLHWNVHVLGLYLDLGSLLHTPDIYQQRRIVRFQSLLQFSGRHMVRQGLRQFARFLGRYGGNLDLTDSAFTAVQEEK